MPRVGSSSSSTSGCRQNPAAKDNLLLVAAGERVDFASAGDGVLMSHGLNARCPSPAAIFLSLRATAPFRYFFEARDDRVRADMPEYRGYRVARRSSVSSAKPFLMDSRGVLLPTRLAVAGDLAGSCASRCRRCSPAVRCVREPSRPATPRISPLRTWMFASLQVGNIQPSGPSTFKMSSSPTTLSFGGKRLVSATADHQTDDLVDRQLFRRARGDPLAVAHDGDVVGNPLEFLPSCGRCRRCRSRAA